MAMRLEPGAAQADSGGRRDPLIEPRLNQQTCTPNILLAVFGPLGYIMESLILAQNERWRRVLSMQVEREGGANLP